MKHRLSKRYLRRELEGSMLVNWSQVGTHRWMLGVGSGRMGELNLG